MCDFYPSGAVMATFPGTLYKSIFIPKFSSNYTARTDTLNFICCVNNAKKMQDIGKSCTIWRTMAINTWRFRKSNISLILKLFQILKLLHMTIFQLQKVVYTELYYKVSFLRNYHQALFFHMDQNQNT